MRLISGFDPHSLPPFFNHLQTRAAKKLRKDELLIIAMAGTRLKMDLDKIPLWRGDHVTVRQVAEDFARYLYLPRLTETRVLLNAVILNAVNDEFDAVHVGTGILRVC